MAGAKATFNLDTDQFEKLTATMEKYGEGAGNVIDDVLHNEGGKLISEEIMMLLPASGRKWKGKKAAAKRAQPFTQEDRPLSVTIKTKPAYGYLYFPDDGTNTRRHVGYKGKPREFMQKGADNRAEEIIDRCINRLIKEWG